MKIITPKTHKNFEVETQTSTDNKLIIKVDGDILLSQDISFHELSKINLFIYDVVNFVITKDNINKLLKDDAG